MTEPKKKRGRPRTRKGTWTTTTLSLPVSAHIQLKHLAVRKSMSLTGLIHLMLREGYEKYSGGKSLRMED